MSCFENNSLLNARRVQGVLVVSFALEVIADEHVQQVGNELMECGVAAESYERKLLLNFAGVKGMSSAMIGKLVLLNKWCKTRMVSLKMCDILPDLLPGFFPGNGSA